MGGTAASCAIRDMARFWQLRSATQMSAGNGGNGLRPFEVLPGVCLTVWNVPPGVRYSLDCARKDRSCTVSFFRTGSAVLDMADGQTMHLGPGDVLVASAKNIVFAAQAPAQCHGVAAYLRGIGGVSYAEVHAPNGSILVEYVPGHAVRASVLCAIHSLDPCNLPRIAGDAESNMALENNRFAVELAGVAAVRFVKRYLLPCALVASSMWSCSREIPSIAPARWPIRSA